MKANGKIHHPDEIKAVRVCTRCEVGVFAALRGETWVDAEGDTTILLQLDVPRFEGLCVICRSRGQDFVL